MQEQEGHGDSEVIFVKDYSVEFSLILVLDQSLNDK